MSTIAIARPARVRGWGLLRVAIPVAAVLGVAAVAGMLLMRGEPPAAQSYYSVVPMALDVRITKDGELQAINNIEIQSQVEGQNTIQQIVAEGSYVKKDDVLIVLDAAEINKKLEEALLELQKAEAEVTAAREQREIQISQNNANLEAAEVELILARLDLAQYSEGTYPQQLSEAQRSVRMAEIDLANKQDELSQTRSLLSRGFVTAADLKKAELDLLRAQNDLEKAHTELHVLTTYSHEKDITDKRNKVAQAEQKLERTQRENASSLAQKDADLRAKQQVHATQKRRHEHLEDQLAKCTMRAPADGLVIYASQDMRMWGGQGPVQEGAQVREQQLLLRLPDTSSMKAVLKINEAQVPRLKLGQRALVKIVGVDEPVPATLTKINVVPDGSQRWWNPDLKEYPIELTLDRTPENLKPGLGVQAEIFVDRLEDVIAVPLPAIYTAREDSYVFLRHGRESLRPHRVTLGASNETHVQVSEGLDAGTEVVLLKAGQGRELLEAAGIRTAPPAPASPVEFDDAPQEELAAQTDQVHE